ncbi:MAG: 50S ribosomal protein L5 [Bacteriovoracia bacterium]
MAENNEDKKTEKKAKPAAEGGAAPEAAKEAKKGGGKEGKGKRDKGVQSDVKIAADGETRISPSATPRLQKLYTDTVVPSLMKQFQFKNPMQVPRIKKVVINCALKEAVGNPKLLDHTYNEIMAITGQKPVFTRAKKAISNFKVRAGIPLAVRVTLRRARMYEFLDRLMNTALPRVRDFRGVNPKSFDGRGNYSMGLREQIIFPEINYDKVEKVAGMTITITTSATKNEHARAMLTELGMPFRK